jgi:chlorophyllide a reductase subunit Z
MGYGGSTYVVQEVCNALFDALFDILPLGTALDDIDETPSRLNVQLQWDEAANQQLERIVASKPVLVRISAAKQLRDSVEAYARARGDSRVTYEHVRTVASRNGAGDAAA